MHKLSRKQFLINSSKSVGGLYAAMNGLGLIPSAPNYPFELNRTSEDRSVIILGAGLAGLATAYELTKLGYSCTILEARDRVGGRCWSIRKGSFNTETDNGSHTANFDEGLYYNAGPSRIPHHHDLTMHYCKELGVQLEVYNNINESTYFYAVGDGPLSNQRIRARQVHNDVRGYTTELLAKAVDSDQIDVQLKQQDIDRLVHYLMAEGGLDTDKFYKASARRGFKVPPIGTEEGVLSEAFTLSDLLSSGLMDPVFYNVPEYTLELQMTMFQAVGGMDKIATVFEHKLDSRIDLNAEVTEIRNTESGVDITYMQEGELRSKTADYCVCTIPLPVLSYIDHNLSSNVSRAIDFATYNKTGKIGLQFKRRFWEEDDKIYGGISRTNNEITQIFYPSNDYHSKNGVLIGYYNFGDNAENFGNLFYDEREQIALEQGSLIHPQYREEFEQSFSVSWHKTKYSMGGWAEYNSRTRESIYKPLLEPDGNIFFAGEHLTYLNAWMAGAFESARSVVADIHNRVNDGNFAYPKSDG